MCTQLNLSTFHLPVRNPANSRGPGRPARKPGSGWQHTHTHTHTHAHTRIHMHTHAYTYPIPIQ